MGLTGPRVAVRPVKEGGVVEVTGGRLRGPRRRHLHPPGWFPHVVARQGVVGETQSIYLREQQTNHIAHLLCVGTCLYKCLYRELHRNQLQRRLFFFFKLNLKQFINVPSGWQQNDKGCCVCTLAKIQDLLSVLLEVLNSMKSGVKKKKRQLQF